MKSLETTNQAQGFKSILVAVDFSETSLKALDYALAVAKEFGSRLFVLHVLEFPAIFNSPKPAHAQWDEGVKERTSVRLSELMAEKVGEAVESVAQVRIGRAYQVICEAAAERNADLIVIGTHGFTGIKHLLLGSTAERVIRHAPCSVLTLRPVYALTPEAVTKPKKILVPTDFSTPAQAALRAAVLLAKQHVSEIQLLHVVLRQPPIGENLAMDYPLLEAEETEAAEKQLASLTESLKKDTVAVRAEIRHGRVAVEINNAAAESNSDLIVIATEGRTGWRHAVLGSTTEEVIRHALCPVLVVRNK